jgi:hypothetical protein
MVLVLFLPQLSPIIYFSFTFQYLPFSNSFSLQLFTTPPFSSLRFCSLIFSIGLCPICLLVSNSAIALTLSPSLSPSLLSPSIYLHPLRSLLRYSIRTRAPPLLAPLTRSLSLSPSLSLSLSLTHSQAICFWLCSGADFSESFLVTPAHFPRSFAKLSQAAASIVPPFVPST